MQLWAPDTHIGLCLFDSLQFVSVSSNTVTRLFFCQQGQREKNWPLSRFSTEPAISRAFFFSLSRKKKQQRANNLTNSQGQLTATQKFCRFWFMARDIIWNPWHLSSICHSTHLNCGHAWASKAPRPESRSCNFTFVYADKMGNVNEITFS